MDNGFSGFYFPRYNAMGGGDPYTHVADQYANQLNALNETQQQGYDYGAKLPTSLAQMFQLAFLKAKQQQQDDQDRQYLIQTRQQALQRGSLNDQEAAYKWISENGASNDPGATAIAQRLVAQTGLPQSAVPQSKPVYGPPSTSGPNLTQDASQGTQLDDGSTVGAHPALNVPMPEVPGSQQQIGSTPTYGRALQATMDQNKLKAQEAQAKIDSAGALQKQRQAMADKYNALTPLNKLLIEAKTTKIIDEGKKMNIDLKYEDAKQLAMLELDKAKVENTKANTQFTQGKIKWQDPMAQATINEKNAIGKAATQNAQTKEDVGQSTIDRNNAGTAFVWQKTMAVPKPYGWRDATPNEQQGIVKNMNSGDPALRLKTIQTAIANKIWIPGVMAPAPDTEEE